jgi:hypothetical protein
MIKLEGILQMMIGYDAREVVYCEHIKDIINEIVKILPSFRMLGNRAHD